MRVMVLIKATEESEAGVMPSQELLTQMGNFNEELVKAGVMLAGDGLHPSSKGVRVAFSGSERKVIDGPFAETKELLAGYWVWQVKSLDEAIEWVKRVPNPTTGRTAWSRSARSSRPTTSATSSPLSCASRRRACGSRPRRTGSRRRGADDPACRRATSTARSTPFGGSSPRG